MVLKELQSDKQPSGENQDQPQTSPLNSPVNTNAGDGSNNEETEIMKPLVCEALSEESEEEKMPDYDYISNDEDDESCSDDEDLKPELKFGKLNNLSSSDMSIVESCGSNTASKTFGGMANSKVKDFDDESEDSSCENKKLSSKERRCLERKEKGKKSGSHYYETANVKNKNRAKKNVVDPQLASRGHSKKAPKRKGRY